MNLSTRAPATLGLVLCAALAACSSDDVPEAPTSPDTGTTAEPTPQADTGSTTGSVSATEEATEDATDAASDTMDPAAAAQVEAPQAYEAYWASVDAMLADPTDQQAVSALEDVSGNVVLQFWQDRAAEWGEQGISQEGTNEVQYADVSTVSMQQGGTGVAELGVCVDVSGPVATDGAGEELDKAAERYRAGTAVVEFDGTDWRVVSDNIQLTDSC
ncbi:MAG: hypothetical protein M3519_04335 [Actinomycetota bacterium]|nr:hypothetical protein [Actinomycetota bacterium]